MLRRALLCALLVGCAASAALGGVRRTDYAAAGCAASAIRASYFFYENTCQNQVGTSDVLYTCTGGVISQKACSANSECGVGCITSTLQPVCQTSGASSVLFECMPDVCPPAWSYPIAIFLAVLFCIVPIVALVIICLRRRNAARARKQTEARQALVAAAAAAENSNRA